MRLSSRLWSRLALAAAGVGLLYYIYSAYFSPYFPPFSLYNQLTRQEISSSLALVEAQPSAKFVFFRQLQGAGFNNQVQEILLFHFLAIQSGRIYTYQNFVWQPRQHSQLPLSAFLPGVTNAHAISAKLFEHVCPEDKVKHVSLAGAHDARWEIAVSVLQGPEQCIVVDDWIMRWDFLASPALHPLWPAFKMYLSEYFRWSPQINDLAERTRPSDGEPYMALHIRRGDFEDHCRGLASSQTGFTTWATMPQLRDSILPPALDPSNATSVMTHCYPSLTRILDAIDAQARANPDIGALHILHDGAWDHPLVYLQYEKLKAAVMSDERADRVGWTGGPLTSVTGSGDLPVRNGEWDFRIGADVELARRAAVFIGIGYSSLSSQIVALRLADPRTARIRDITLV